MTARKPTKPKAARIPLSERLEKVEEMLCAGLSPGRIEAILSRSEAEDGFGVTQRQVRNYINRVYERWQEQSAADAPHRREKIFLMAERFYTRCLTAKSWAAAAQALAILVRVSGVPPLPPHEQAQLAGDPSELIKPGDLRQLTNIDSAARGGDWRAAAWLLERSNPERYGPPASRVNIGGVPGQPIEVTPSDAVARLAQILDGMTKTE